MGVLVGRRCGRHLLSKIAAPVNLSTQNHLNSQTGHFCRPLVLHGRNNSGSVLCCSHYLKRRSLDSNNTHSMRHMMIRWCSSSRLSREKATLQGKVDKYGGIWVNLAHSEGDEDIQHLSEAEFDLVLKASLNKWQQEGLTAVWLKVPISLSKFIVVAGKYGFHYHHAEGDIATLALWINEDTDSKLPLFASHQVGVSGIVINEETREVLVVQDKNRHRILWKFPGGLSDLSEDIAATAEREVFEETGVKAEFQSILAFRQQHNQPGAFGRSDIYILCRLKPVTFDLRPCSEEIQACEWMPVHRLLTEPQASTLTHRLAGLVTRGLDAGFDQVDITSNQFQSIHRGLVFQLFHRPL